MRGDELDRCPYCGEERPCGCPNAEIDRLRARLAGLEDQLDHWSERATKAESELDAIRSVMRKLFRFMESNR